MARRATDRGAGLPTTKNTLGFAGSGCGGISGLAPTGYSISGGQNFSFPRAVEVVDGPPKGLNIRILPARCPDHFAAHARTIAYNLDMIEVPVVPRGPDLGADEVAGVTACTQLSPKGDRTIFHPRSIVNISARADRRLHTGIHSKNRVLGTRPVSWVRIASRCTGCTAPSIPRSRAWVSLSGSTSAGGSAYIVVAPDAPSVTFLGRLGPELFTGLPLVAGLRSTREQRRHLVTPDQAAPLRASNLATTTAVLEVLDPLLDGSRCRIVTSTLHQCRKGTVVTESGHEAAHVAARMKLSQLEFGHMATQVVGVAVQLKLPDAIGDHERSAEELASEYDTPPQTMNRLLRALAALEVLTENSPGRFTLTQVGSLLRTDRPDSMHAFTRIRTDPAIMQSWQRLDFSVRTGRTAFDEVFGTDFFSHLKIQSAMSALFNAAMSAGTRAVADTLPSHYDFGRFHTVADIGGGDGTLIAAILAEHPPLRGILFDSAEGLTQAEDTLGQAAVSDRCVIEVGDFFTAVPSGAELYILKNIVHDWDDDHAATILGHCRRVVPEDGRLLIIERVLPETVDPTLPPFAHLSDLNMLVIVGGLERTRAEFERLCERSGFTLTNLTPLPPYDFSLIEAAPSPNT